MTRPRSRARLARRLLAAALFAVALCCSVLAARRPYADNQRSWLVIVAVLAVLAALTPLLLRLLRTASRAVADEWTRRPVP